MLSGLCQMVIKWRCSPNSQHCTDEHNKSFQSKAAAACLMRRLVALTRIRNQLGLRQHVVIATLVLVQALQQSFPGDVEAGVYTFELQLLIHQVPFVHKLLGPATYWVGLQPSLSACKLDAAAWGYSDHPEAFVKTALICVDRRCCLSSAVAQSLHRKVWMNCLYLTVVGLIVCTAGHFSEVWRQYQIS